MKTLKNTGITLFIAFAASTSLLAQTTNPKSGEDAHFAATKTSYHQPTALGFDDAASYTRRIQPVAKAPAKTFATSLYRVQKSMKMRLSIEKKFGETVSVRLLNEDGKELHRKSVSRRIQKYGCNFDFSKVKDGDYTIEIANGDEVQRKSVHLGSIEVVEKPARTLVALN